MVADIAFWKAALVALLPAAFIGPYIGGLLAMGRASSRIEHASAPTVLDTAGRREPPLAA